jgi:hypothetical protein
MADSHSMRHFPKQKLDLLRKSVVVVMKEENNEDAPSKN